jgi:formyltetrahydrofolate hydrolase
MEWCGKYFEENLSNCHFACHKLHTDGHILEQSVIILNATPLFMQLLEARQAVDCMGLATGISQVLFSKVQVFNCTWVNR